MCGKSLQFHLTLALAVIAIVGCQRYARESSHVSELTEAGRYDVYLPGAGIILGGILYRPAVGEEPLPGVLVLHGWAQRGVPGAARLERQAEQIAGRGYVSLALSLRGWPNSEGVDDCGLKQPDDIVSAAKWLGSLSGVRRERIGVVGFSLGGQIALLAASRSKRLKAVVAFYPPTDIERWAKTTSNERVRDSYIPQTCFPARKRSPVFVAQRIEAPVLLIHGDRDDLVPTEQSLIMRDALAKANRAVELHVVAQAEHGFDYGKAGSVAEKFLDCHLKMRCP